MIRILLVLIAAGTLATSIADTASAQQLVQRRDVSYAVALAIATGAVDACRALGFTSSAVVVVGTVRLVSVPNDPANDFVRFRYVLAAIRRVVVVVPLAWSAA